MKYYLLLLVFAGSCFLTHAENIPAEELQRLKDQTKIGSVNDDVVDIEQGDEDYEFFELKFYTVQYPDDAKKYKFYARVLVELTDSKTRKPVYAKGTAAQSEVDESYLGEDEWQFLLPLGELKRPKVTAFVIQYGIYVDKEFIVLVEEYDEVESLDEMTERISEQKQAEGKVMFYHRYLFEDADDDEAWSFGENTVR